MTDLLRIATRQSPLALWQANSVRSQLMDAHAGLKVELLPITTEGDRKLGTSLAKIGGKGLFIKELEAALLDGRADIAVHSMKDVTAVVPEGLTIGTLLKREDPRDALVSVKHGSINDLPENAIIGTCSPRRLAQLLNRYPNFQIKDMRGNVGTRLHKLETGEFDATLLACAGLERLGLQERIAQVLPMDLCLPAVAQGTIGIELREGDENVQALISVLNDEDTATRTKAERALSAALNGGCSAPVAGFSQTNGNSIELIGRVIAMDGTKLLEARDTSTLEQAHQLGVSVAQSLLEQGAQAILDDAELHSSK